MKEVLQLLEDYLEPTGFVANSKSLTIADLPILANYTALKACDLLISQENYPNIRAWHNRCSKLIGNFEKISVKGSEDLSVFFKDELKKVQG